MVDGKPLVTFSGLAPTAHESTSALTEAINSPGTMKAAPMPLFAPTDASIGSSATVTIP
jgi:hypothetical protein